MKRSLSCLRLAITQPVMYLLCCLLVAVSVVRAADIPDFDKEVLINAREQSVQRFVTELFGRIKLPVVVAPEITGTVNGDFSGTVESVFDKVSKAFYVTHYFDGSVVYVYPANKTKRVFHKLNPSVRDKVLANAEQLSLPDASNTLTKTDMGVMVSGSERFHGQVEEIVAALNRQKPAQKPQPQPTGDSFRMFRLRYAWAHDVEMDVGGRQIVVPGVASTLRRLIEPVEGAAGKQSTSVDNTVQGLRGQGLADKQPAGTGERLFGSSASAHSRIVADSLNNAVLIRDKPERLDAYRELIDSLDVEPKMVEIEATIIDMDTDRLRELGINWRAQFEDGEALFGTGTQSDASLLPDVQITPTGAGGILSLVLGDEERFISRIRALETQGAARIVSKPHVMTLSNVEALLDTTSTFFVRVQGQEEVDLFNVSVGTTLRVTPHVFDGPIGDRIKLLVAIEDGSTSEQQVDNIPVIETSSINTQALVNVGESLLIGGLVREFKGNTLTKVPVLGDIPGLGALFRNNQKTSSRVERMFLISPRISLRPGGQNPTRLNEPYLSGTEGEIVVTAPSRLDATSQALAARDDYFGVKERLPAVGPDVTLSAKETPANVVRIDTLEARPSGTADPAFNTWQPVQRTRGGLSQTSHTGVSPSDVVEPADSSDDEWQTISQ